jgi:hypothetical protein
MKAHRRSYRVREAAKADPGKNHEDPRTPQGIRPSKTKKKGLKTHFCAFSVEKTHQIASFGVPISIKEGEGQKNGNPESGKTDRLEKPREVFGTRTAERKAHTAETLEKRGKTKTPGKKDECRPQSFILGALNRIFVRFPSRKRAIFGVLALWGGWRGIGENDSDADQSVSGQ